MMLEDRFGYFHSINILLMSKPCAINGNSTHGWRINNGGYTINMRALLASDCNLVTTG